jgi:hypothetical protein
MRGINNFGKNVWTNIGNIFLYFRTYFNRAHRVGTCPGEVKVKVTPFCTLFFPEKGS